MYSVDVSHMYAFTQVGSAKYSFIDLPGHLKSNNWKRSLTRHVGTENEMVAGKGTTRVPGGTPLDLAMSPGSKEEEMVL